MANDNQTLQDKFLAFHADNPGVYKRLVELARDLLGRGFNRIGLKMLWEIIRWEGMMQTTDGEYLLNNNITPHYARLIMATEPDLAGAFETRRQKVL